MSRRETGDSRRAHIIAAAIEVLAREGPGEATTRKIAAAAGVNQAMISYYFGGKDELLYAVLDEMMRLTADIARAALPTSPTLREALTGALTAFWRHVEAAPELQVMQVELTLYALRRPDAAWVARRQYEGYRAVVAELIREALATTGEASATSPDALARFIIGGLDGLILQFVSDRDSERAEGDLRRLITATAALLTTATPDTPTPAC